MSAVLVTVPGMDASVWANLIAALALVVAVVTLALSRRDVRAARRSAADADVRADRATRAAEKSAAAHREIADATPKPRVEWELSHLAGDLHLLRQVGDAAAHAVEVTHIGGLVHLSVVGETPDPMRKNDNVQLNVDIRGGSSTTLEVTWRDAHGTPDVWRSPV